MRARQLAPLVAGAFLMSAASCEDEKLVLDDGGSGGSAGSGGTVAPGGSGGAPEEGGAGGGGPAGGSGGSGGDGGTTGTGGSGGSGWVPVDQVFVSPDGRLTVRLPAGSTDGPVELEVRALAGDDGARFLDGASYRLQGGGPLLAPGSLELRVRGPDLELPLPSLPAVSCGDLLPAGDRGCVPAPRVAWLDGELPLRGCAVETVAEDVVFTCAIDDASDRAVGLAFDAELPAVSAPTASPAVLDPAGPVALEVIASHGGGLEAVEFYEVADGAIALPAPATGFAGLAAETSPGVFSLAVAVDVGDLSPRRFVAVARALSGSVVASEEVTVRRAELPRIEVFAADPPALPYGGGSTQLSWRAANASSLRLDPGGIDVTGSEGATLELTQTTTFVLTATSIDGTATAELAVTVEPFETLYVSPDGSDDAPGSVDEPLLTLAHALGEIDEGGTVILLDGTYDSTTQPTFGRTDTRWVDVPDGIEVRARNEGGAILQGDAGNGLRMLGSGVLRDLDLRGFGTAVSASSGDVTFDRLHFEDGHGGIDLTGTVVARLTPPSSGEIVTAPFAGLARLSDEARLTVAGGVIDGTSARSGWTDAILRATGSSSLTLEGVTLSNSTMPGVLARGSAGVVLDGCTLEKLASAGWSVDLDGSVVVELVDTELQGAYGGVILRGSSTADASVSFVRSTVRDTSYVGFFTEFTSKGSVVLDASTFTGNGWNGLEIRGGLAVDVQGSDISSNDAHGIYAVNAGAVIDLRVRGTTIEKNAYNGVFISGDAGSSFDLGTVDDPGGNTIRDSGAASASFCNLWVGDVPEAVEAVGNTWNASEQNADEDGRYVPADGEDHVELEGQLLSTGFKNVRIQQVGDVVKL